MDKNHSPPASKGRPLFPPLMNTIDTYVVDAAAEDRSANMIEASKSTGKKKMRKGRRKKLLAPIKKDGLEEVSELTHFSSVSAHKPVLGSPKKSKSAGKLDERGHHPELEEDDDRDNFSAMNPVHESPLKPVTPGSRRAMQGPPRTSPRAGRTYKEPEASVVSSSLEVRRHSLPLSFLSLRSPSLPVLRSPCRFTVAKAARDQERRRIVHARHRIHRGVEAPQLCHASTTAHCTKDQGTSTLALLLLLLLLLLLVDL